MLASLLICKVATVTQNNPFLSLFPYVNFCLSTGPERWHSSVCWPSSIPSSLVSTRMNPMQRPSESSLRTLMIILAVYKLEGWDIKVFLNTRRTSVTGLLWRYCYQYHWMWERCSVVLKRCKNPTILILPSLGFE